MCQGLERHAIQWRCTSHVISYLSHALADDLNDRALCPAIEFLQLLLHVSLEVPVGLLRGDVELLFVLRLLQRTKTVQRWKAEQVGERKG